MKESFLENFSRGHFPPLGAKNPGRLIPRCLLRDPSSMGVRPTRRSVLPTAEPIYQGLFGVMGPEATARLVFRRFSRPLLKNVQRKSILTGATYFVQEQHSWRYFSSWTNPFGRVGHDFVDRSYLYLDHWNRCRPDCRGCCALAVVAEKSEGGRDARPGTSVQGLRPFQAPCATGTPLKRRRTIRKNRRGGGLPGLRTNHHRIRRRLSGDVFPRWERRRRGVCLDRRFRGQGWAMPTPGKWGDKASGHWGYDIGLSSQNDPSVIGVLVGKHSPRP